jgi:hypothetical protein
LLRALTWFGLGYLACGAVLFAWLALLFLVDHAHSLWQDFTRPGPPSASRIRRGVSWLLQWVAFPVLAACVIAIVWPIVLAFDRESVFRLPRRAVDPPPEPPAQEFSIARADLMRRWTLAEIERDAMIEDPLRAVPPVPFGHLHRAWIAFRGQVGDDDELWSFVTRWSGPRRDGDYVRAGFVILRAGAIWVHFAAPLPFRVAAPVTDRADS